MIDGNNNLLNKEEVEQLKNALELKKNIISYLNMDSFIEHTRDVIEKSENFAFRSIASKLYIDKKQPVFVLKLKDESLLTEIKKSTNPIDRVSKLLQMEIIQNISKLLTDCIKEESNNIFEGIPKEITEFVISNIYVIRSNIKDNNIQLFFFI